MELVRGFISELGAVLDQTADGLRDAYPDLLVARESHEGPGGLHESVVAHWYPASQRYEDLLIQVNVVEAGDADREVRLSAEGGGRSDVVERRWVVTPSWSPSDVESAVDEARRALNDGFPALVRSIALPNLREDSTGLRGRSVSGRWWTAVLRFRIESSEPGRSGRREEMVVVADLGDHHDDPIESMRDRGHQLQTVHAASGFRDEWVFEGVVSCDYIGALDSAGTVVDRRAGSEEPLLEPVPWSGAQGPL